MIVFIIGIILGVSFLLKAIIQILLDGVVTDAGGKPDSNFYIRYFLPYGETVNQKYKVYKKICNVCYYIFIISATLYVMLWNIQ